MKNGVLTVAQETWRFSMAVSTSGTSGRCVASYTNWLQILCISGSIVQWQFCHIPTRLKPRCMCSAMHFLFASLGKKNAQHVGPGVKMGDSNDSNIFLAIRPMLAAGNAGASFTLATSAQVRSFRLHNALVWRGTSGVGLLRSSFWRTWET